MNSGIEEMRVALDTQQGERLSFKRKTVAEAVREHDDEVREKEHVQHENFELKQFVENHLPDHMG